MKLPSLQFYPGDWHKDQGVQALDLEHRGAWFEILLMMHDSDERGVLVVNGVAMPEPVIARRLGLDNQKCNQILTTLLTYGVTSRRESDGALYCRRMVRDEKLRQIRTEAGRKGGNPLLLKQKPTTGVKQSQTTRVKQKTTPSSSSSSSDEDTHTTTTRAREPDPLDDSDVPTKPEALAAAFNLGIPNDFAGMVYEAWKANGGCNGNGIVVPWRRQVHKRWQGNEGVQWKAGTHREQKSGYGGNGHSQPEPSSSKPDRWD